MLGIPAFSESIGDKVLTSDFVTRFFKSRVIFVYGEIDNTSAGIICSQLLFLDEQDSSKDIYMYINSPGGSIIDGLSIYDTMQFVNAPITTLCVGAAYSMGSILLMAGTKNKRYALPHSEVLVHQPIGSCIGKEADIQIHAQQFTFWKSKICDIMQEHTGLERKKIYNMMEHDTFLTPTLAMQLGIIDGIISSKHDIQRCNVKSGLNIQNDTDITKNNSMTAGF